MILSANGMVNCITTLYHISRSHTHTHTHTHTLLYRDGGVPVHWHASVHNHNLLQLQSDHLESDLDSDWSGGQHLSSLLPCQQVQDSQHQSQDAVYHVVLW